MHRFKLLSSIAAVLLVASNSILFSQNPNEFFPAISADDQIINHVAYSLKYNEQHEQAEWVFYVLTKDKADGHFERTDDFRADPAVATGSASLEDYRGSGYDRGHLAPAADMAWSQEVMSESFFLSNMSPQKPGFNRAIWRNLEALVRDLATEYEEIYVVTGPVLKEIIETIGPNQVSVPKYYYKVILDYKEPELKGIGFIMANESSRQPLQDFAVSIDSVEKFTGIDFFPALPDSIEDALELEVATSRWSFFVPQQRSSSKAAELRSTQCQGITQQGDRCQRMTTNDNGYCWQHQDQVKARTRDAETKESNAAVYITKSGSKYHRASCSYLKKSRIKISLQDAKKRGCTPCSRCKPPR